jgi:hypothetical protein
MTDHVILTIGETKFVLTTNEAFGIANILNGSTQITTAWLNGKSRRVYGEPKMDAAHIAPINGPLQLELETNTKEREASK